MGGLDDLLGGKALLGRGGGAAEAEEAGDLGDLQAGVAVQQPVAEQARGVVIDAAALAEVEGGFEDVALGGGQAILGDAGSREPVGKGGGIRGHGKSSLTGVIPPVYGAARGSLRERAEQPLRDSRGIVIKCSIPLTHIVIRCGSERECPGIGRLDQQLSSKTLDRTLIFSL
jgi:hypothetical protein